MCLSHQRDKRRKVVIFVENISTTISSIEDVINVSTL